ncbi:Solute carrier organic anion transporter family member 4C1 [Hypsibius exemplaris]|uniref:Solute carrier organic anion transporter family member n=1 Tax=Hypsibius exemplaris TaxID=2072580 RepID=A0A1W0WYU0_HYPEX|nr:Solute carrier organic anion transporter family member 4C1 [Hypsibius exemplaris]
MEPCDIGLKREFYRFAVRDRRRRRGRLVTAPSSNKFGSTCVYCTRMMSASEEKVKVGEIYSAISAVAVTPPPPYREKQTVRDEDPSDQRRTTETVVYEYDEDLGPENDDDAERCGIACFKPDAIQPLRNMKVFLVVFILAGISQGMFYTIWNMTLSSIEKRFQIPSQTTGIISAINDVSHICVVLFVAHFCGRGHRPRWLAAGLFTVGIAILTFATPELFAPKWDMESVVLRTNTTKGFDKEMCLTTAQSDVLKEQCRIDAPNLVNKNLWAFVLLGTAQVLLGIGTTAPIVLAMPFIDDNVKTKNTPIYFSLGFAGRFIGPMTGVFLGSFCLSTYIDLTKTPNISQTDPRWMGAWYLGFIIVGTITCCVSTLYLFFPAKVPATQKIKAIPGASVVLRPSAKTNKAAAGSESGGAKKKSEPAKKETLREQFAAIPRDLKRLWVNKVFVCRVANDAIDMLVVSGYFTFAPKYLEYHFRMSPAQAGKWNGMASISAVVSGALIGGIVIRRLKLQPKHVALMICFSSFMISICYFFLMMVTCEPRNLFSVTGPDNMLLVNSSCGNGCNCDRTPFSPVCDQSTGLNYYSPCHAGCSQSFTRSDGAKNATYYGGCSCLAPPGWKFSDPLDSVSALPTTMDDLDTVFPERNENDGVLKRGFCEGGCSGFMIYVIISTCFKFIGALPFSGNQMLSFRIVDQDLKSLSKAVRTLVASLFAFIPGPIIMGALFDSACRLWNTQSCGAKGACLVYDLDSLRLKMHLYVAIVKTAACVMDVYVYYKVRNMKFERKVEPEPVAEPQSVPTGSVRDLTAFD